MSDQSSSNNKRIAKNTLLLYFRMLFMMAVSLFTSRVILNTLGVEDYGIYNVVGGVVAMFGFINGSMASATQRYITFALGKGDEDRLKTIFSTTLQIHALISVLIVILGETVGLWFLYNKMIIPDGRMDAAFWVLQCSIVSTVVMIMSVPYNADIIAHEKMSAFAYISVLEVILKLAIVYMLVIFSFDKLILFAFLVLAIQILIRMIFSFYCNRHFKESKYRHVWDRQLFKEMTGFAGWSLFGNLSVVLFTQGLNMLLNIFFGPVVNAARAIAVQVQHAMQQFVSNFQMALNPQITKTYAKGDLQEMHKLIIRSARFSFYLLFLLSLPVLLETNFILQIWLINVPNNTVVFLRIMICTMILSTIANPLMIANQASGMVKKYQIVCGSIQMLILPISYIFLKIGYPAYSVFIVHFFLEIVTQIARMLMLRSIIGIKMIDYITHIYTKVIVVALLSAIVPTFLYFYLNETFIRFILICFLSFSSVIASSYFFGLTNTERVFIRTKLKNIINNVNIR